MMLVVAGILALTIGVTLGLLGGGGSILTVPVLVYALHVDAEPAITSSLLVVGVTALVATFLHARAGNVSPKIGLIFGVSGMLAAFVGGRAAAFVPGSVLLVAFALVMLVTALAMLRPRREPDPGETRRVELGRTVSAGMGVGLVAGLIGAGGGFLIVPALVFFGGLDMRRAIGTSLLVIALQSFAGFAGHVTHTSLDWTLTLVVAGSAVVGSFGGARLAHRVSPAMLRRSFAWFVLAMAVVMLARQASVLAAR